MNSQLITEPDFVNTTNTPLLLIEPDPLILKLIIDTCSSLDATFDVFVCSGETDREWFNRVTDHAEVIFKRPTFDEVYQFLKKTNER
jgi:hypothetical protein